MSQGKVVGIIGGMGAGAGADFYRRLVGLTPASTDQDHIKAILYSNTAIPDRTEAIMGRGPDPLPELIKSARMLEDNGAEIIVLACVSAHYYIGELRQRVSCRIPGAVEETLEYLLRSYPGINRVGVMGTTGTISSEMFQNRLKKAGREPVILDHRLQQELVMEGIYGKEGIKAGNITRSRNKIIEAAGILIQQNAEALILGCSELPLAVGPGDLDIPVLDSMEILIRKTVSLCGK